MTNAMKLFLLYFLTEIVHKAALGAIKHIIFQSSSLFISGLSINKKIYTTIYTDKTKHFK